MPRCLIECNRVLAPAGRLIFSLDHPARHCFFDAEEDELSIVPTRSYFDDRPIHWRWPGRADIMLESFHHTIAQWVELLSTAGFGLVRLLEPVPPPEVLEAIFPVDGALAPLRLLPQSIIFVAEKR
jgi:hypothetical protein